VHIADRHLHGKGERNGVQRRIKVSFGRAMMQSIGAAAVGEKARLRMKQR